MRQVAGRESLIINIHIVYEINFAISLAGIIDFWMNNQIHIWYNDISIPLVVRDYQ